MTAFADAMRSRGLTPRAVDGRVVWLDPAAGAGRRTPAAGPEREDLVRAVAAALAPLPDLPAQPVLLTGPVGSGKSTLARQAAALLDLPLWVLPGSEALQPSALVAVPCGVVRDAHDGRVEEHFAASPLTSAVALGGLCLVEELDKLPAGVHDAIAHLITTRELVCPEYGLRFAADAAFGLIATQNSPPEALPEALADRMRPRFVVPLPGRELVLRWWQRNQPQTADALLAAWDRVNGEGPGAPTTRQVLGTLTYAYRLWAQLGRPPLTGALAAELIERSRRDS